MRNVTGIEQINDEIITHTKWDPKTLISVITYTVFTLAAFLVALSNAR